MDRFPKLVSCIKYAMETAEENHDNDACEGGCGLRPVPLLQLHLPGSKPLYQPYKGQLQLSIYYYDGIITVHVLSARDLCNATMSSSTPHTTSAHHPPRCSTYVKLSLLPSRASASSSHKSHWRSDVVVAQPDANDLSYQWTWDEQFSIELSDAAIECDDVNADVDEEIAKGRLLVTVWHREPMKTKGPKRKRRNTQETTRLLGCMSFSLRNIKQKRQVIDEWFYLLSEELGLWKHLAAETDALSSTFLKKPPALSQLRKSKRKSSRYQQPGSSYQHRASYPPQSQPSHQPRSSLPAKLNSDQVHPQLPTSKRHPLQLKSCIPQQKSGIPGKKRNVTFLPSPPANPQNTLSSTTVTSSTTSSIEETEIPLVGKRKKLFVHRGRQGYGLSLTGQAPPVVSSVTSCSEAWMAGVKVGDRLLAVGRQNVQSMNGVEAAAVIKKQQKQGIILEILRPMEEAKDQQLPQRQPTQKDPKHRQPQSIQTKQTNWQDDKENQHPRYILIDDDDIQIHRPADRDEIFAQSHTQTQIELCEPLRSWQQYPEPCISESIIV